MNDSLAKQAGAAVGWKTAQLAGVKIIFLARLLILARLLSPEDFGLLAIAMVAIGFLLSITNLGMIPALVQHPDADENLYDGAWTVGVLRALTITGVVSLAAPVIAHLFAEPRATEIIRVLAFRPLLEAVSSIKVAELTRKFRFRSLALISLSEATVEAIIAIALVYVFGVWALVVGALAGAMAGVVMSYFLAPYRPRLSLDRAAIRPLIRYGRWVFLTGLVSLTGSSVLQVVVSRRLGVAELGLYFLAAKLAFLPYEMASQVVGSVAFPLYARLQSNAAQAVQAFQTILTGIASMLLPIYGLMIALAPTLVQDVLGPRWAGTAPVIQLLALVGILGLCGDAIGPMLQGFGRPDQVMVLEVIQSSLLILLIWTLAGYYGLMGAALAWVPAIGISQIFSAAFARQLLGRPFAGLGMRLLVITAAAGTAAGVAAAVDRVLPGLIGFVLAGLASTGATAAVLLILDRSLELGLVVSLLRAFPQLGVLARFDSIHCRVDRETRLKQV
jgi:O-antigen/teichoic acid export membrane protein